MRSELDRDRYRVGHAALANRLTTPGCTGQTRRSTVS